MAELGDTVTSREELVHLLRSQSKAMNSVAHDLNLQMEPWELEISMLLHPDKEHLGVYQDERAAARAVDRHSILRFGIDASLSFPLVEYLDILSKLKTWLRTLEGNVNLLLVSHKSKMLPNMPYSTRRLSILPRSSTSQPQIRPRPRYKRAYCLPPFQQTTVQHQPLYQLLSWMPRITQLLLASPDWPRPPLWAGRRAPRRRNTLVKSKRLRPPLQAMRWQLKAHKLSQKKAPPFCLAQNQQPPRVPLILWSFIRCF